MSVCCCLHNHLYCLHHVFRQAHKNRAPNAEEPHKKGGESLKAIIFGGLDGILTSFAIVAGAAGGGMGWDIVLVLGISNIFADALSMGVGEYLSSKAENEYIMSERAREEWELHNFRQGEIEEMVDLYEDRGMSREDAEIVINKMAKYDNFFVDVMMVEELGLQVPGEDDDLVRDGIIMFCSFAVFGSMPLLGYVVFPLVLPGASSDFLFSAACIVTAITLFTMGALKSNFSTRAWYTSGLETLLLGACCAFLAYYIGRLVDNLIPDANQ